VGVGVGLDVPYAGETEAGLMDLLARIAFLVRLLARHVVEAEQ